VIELERGDNAYLPDGRCGEVLDIHRHLNYSIDDVLVRYRGEDGSFEEEWFAPEHLNALSFNERLRRIEKRLGIDD
jgi:hypothetical protein